MLREKYSIFADKKRECLGLTLSDFASRVAPPRHFSTGLNIVGSGFRLLFWAIFSAYLSRSVGDTWYVAPSRLFEFCQASEIY